MLTLNETIRISLAVSSDAAAVEGRLMGVYFKGRLSRGVSPKTTVLLNGGRFQTGIDRDGVFEFPDVPTGTYILEVQSPYLVYSKVRVSVQADGRVVPSRVSIGDHWSSQHNELPMPLVLRPRPRPIHYVPPEGAKVMGWFGNPMILMASFSALMLLLMPRIMANLDENALDQLRSSYHLSCLPSIPHFPHPQHQHLSYAQQQQQQEMYQQQHYYHSSKSMYPSSSPYMVDGALDQHPSSFFRSPAPSSTAHFTNAAPSEPYIVPINNHGRNHGPGMQPNGSLSSTATLTMNNAMVPPVQSKKEK
ncbi:hypothetical protein BGZ94_008638 [Podila epigama]|nr:hypothetical protein BGZ94_008638 [Podila epigama]